MVAIGANLGHSQSPNISALESQRTTIQKMIRAYQDTLADLDFMISELETGNAVDVSEVTFYNKTKNKKTNSTDRLRSNNRNNEIANTKHSGTNPERVISKNVSKVNIRRTTNSFSTTPRPRTQTKVYRRRVGAICRDGTRSYATGRGACSHHGGVRNWLVQ